MMKIRISILISCLLFILACSEKDIIVKNPGGLDPILTLYSPNNTTSYPASNPLSIQGEVIDYLNIESFSIAIFREAGSNQDTLFYKTSPVDSTRYSFNRIWQPDIDFTGTSKTFEIEFKINYDSIFKAPPATIYRSFKVVK